MSPTTRAASLPGIAPSSTRIRHAVSEPSASSPTTPAAPHMPAWPCLSRLLAHLGPGQIELLADERRCSVASCLSSSPIGRSRSSSSRGLELATLTAPSGADGGTARQRRRRCRRHFTCHDPVVVRVLRLVPAAARRLGEAGRQEAEHGTAAGDEPRPLPREPLDVTEQAAPVRRRQVVAEAIGAVGDLLDDLRLRLLLFAPQPLGGLPQRRRGLVIRLPVWVERMSISSRTRSRVRAFAASLSCTCCAPASTRSFTCSVVVLDARARSVVTSLMLLLSPAAHAAAVCSVRPL